jgi:hypothetical protein
LREETGEGGDLVEFFVSPRVRDFIALNKPRDKCEARRHDENMDTPTAILRRINARNHEFWLEQSELLAHRIADPELFQKAFSKIECDEIVYPLKYRRTLEQAFADAEQGGLRKPIARKGCMKAKTDSLQQLVLKAVWEERDIDERRLFFWIKDQLGGETIFSINHEKIEFLNYNGKLKKAPVSGLKDRLSRAKRRINSL